jgi:hypothetical protein
MIYLMIRIAEVNKKPIFYRFRNNKKLRKADGTLIDNSSIVKESGTYTIK